MQKIMYPVYDEKSGMEFWKEASYFWNIWFAYKKFILKLLWGKKWEDHWFD